MHFFYLDESGDTGRNLSDPDQPVLVLAGVCVRDKAWNTTQEKLRKLFQEFFGNSLPSGFEFHAKDALCPAGEGFFVGRSMAERTQLAKNILTLLVDQSHGTFYTALDKAKIRDSELDLTIEYNHRRAYPLAFDANLSAINQHVKNRLGRSARGMVFFDEKETHHSDVRALMMARRYEVPKVHRIKWVVEYGHPLDSRANPMIQLADLVAYSVRRFLEAEHGYRPNWSDATTRFCAECYEVVDSRLLWKTATHRPEVTHRALGPYLEDALLKPRNGWRSRYALSARSTPRS